jgi:hypothetical protein
MDDEPMTIIQRHHEAVLSEHMLYHAISELSAVIGGFLCSKDDVYTWCTEAGEGDLVAQVSRHGIFLVDDCVTKEKRYQIAGACYFYGIPLFMDHEVFEMIEQETTESPAKNNNLTIN